VGIELRGWLSVLSDEDIQFLKRFLLASGSLKALAGEYGISYPTVRVRLDRLIEKVKAADDPAAGDPFRRQLRAMVAEGVLNGTAAKTLLAAHQSVLAESKGGRDEQA
jgi:hypothetical protein